MPCARPVTLPNEASIEAKLVDEGSTLHVPPVAVFVKLIMLFTHTVRGPPIVDGNGFTVNTVVILQPVNKV